jgi:hypothetical protein
MNATQLPAPAATEKRHFAKPSIEYTFGVNFCGNPLVVRGKCCTFFRQSRPYNWSASFSPRVNAWNLYAECERNSPAPPVLPNSINGCEMGLREMPSKCQKLIFLSHLRDSTSAGLKIHGTQLMVLADADIKIDVCIRVNRKITSIFPMSFLSFNSLSAVKTMRFS